MLILGGIVALLSICLGFSPGQLLQYYGRVSTSKEVNNQELAQHAKRAFFFGSAALALLFHLLAMLLASLVVVFVLYRSEFSSTAL